MPSLSKWLLAFLALVSLARADYYIDDQNYTSLFYSENQSGAFKWEPFQQGGQSLFVNLPNGTLFTVDISPCYNLTITYAACTTTDGCLVQFPFSGSGITVYVLQAGAQGINASLTIDQGVTNSVLPAPPAPNFYFPRAVLFDVQGLTTGNHTAIMTVLGWNGTFSGMMFDYVLVNQTVVSPTATNSLSTSTTAPTSTVTPSPSNSSTNVGAIVGGVIGGLAALVAVFFAIFYLRRQSREVQRSTANPDMEPRIEPFSPEILYHQGAQRYTDTTERPTSERISSGTLSTQVLPPSTIPSPFPHDKSRLAVLNPDTSRSTDVSVASSSQAGQSPSSPPLPLRPRAQQTESMLTNDQADFVNSLYANNVPPGAIARVIERLMAGERGSAMDVHDSLPPSYYHDSGGR